MNKALMVVLLNLITSGLDTISTRKLSSRMLAPTVEGGGSEVNKFEHISSDGHQMSLTSMGRWLRA